ncbi:MAG: hypothetical protein LWW96_08490 [Acidovorax sp.]|uniref:hypothetical protein n=1 Tax=Acidovorax sp. TaxID=1872122 RepID=UPI0025BE973D|nr:hypothetical protein [Acidovorax sp.]MCE1192176.1 hypothetical protein [Acidovorax sp.]
MAQARALPHGKTSKACHEWIKNQLDGHDFPDERRRFLMAIVIYCQTIAKVVTPPNPGDYCHTPAI